MKITKNIAISLALLVSALGASASYWWEECEFSATPTNNLSQAVTVLQEQEETMWRLERVSYASDAKDQSTNLWHRLAMLHGDLRSKNVENVSRPMRRVNRIDYTMGMDPVVNSNITAQILALQSSITNTAVLRQEYERILTDSGVLRDDSTMQRLFVENEANKLMWDYQNQRANLEKRTRMAMMRISASAALAAFPANERNSIVSNIVELARFTPDEAASLGLTNVVVNAGER